MGSETLSESGVDIECGLTSKTEWPRTIFKKPSLLMSTLSLQLGL